MKEALSTMGGFVLGIARTMVTPPARAAAVPELKSSLCVAPGSRRCTCTSIKPKVQGIIVTYLRIIIFSIFYHLSLASYHSLAAKKFRKNLSVQGCFHFYFN